MSERAPLLKLICGTQGGIFARVVRTEYGPTLTYLTRKPSGAFLRSDGALVGRWALGEKQEGRLEAFPWEWSIVLREPRWYRVGEHSDPVNEATSGTVEASCDRCSGFHQLDLATVTAAVRSRIADRFSADVLVAGRTVH